MRALLIGAVATAWLAAAAPPQIQKSPPDPTRIELSIETQASCIGCPAWRVTFFGIGRAQFVCLGACAIQGPRDERIAAADVSALVGAFEAAGFFEIPRTRPAGCMDCGLETLTYRDERRIHEVIYMGAPPSELRALREQLLKATQLFDKYKSPTAANYDVLLREGWDPNAQFDAEGSTMLTYAALGMQTGAVELLLKHGARVDSRTLRFAVWTPTFPSLWTAAGLKPDAAEAGSLLRQAAGGGHTENVAFLVGKGVDANARDPEKGLTPLMEASSGSYRELVSWLLEHGARADPRDTDGNQALWFAVARDSTPGVVDVLLSRNLRVDDLNNGGRTPLMHAAEMCAAGNIKTLLAAGADAKRRDKSGKAAIDLVPVTRAWRIEDCERARAVLTAK